VHCFGGGLLDKIKKNDFKVFILAFSPQTLLYPYNENIIGTPSYTNSLLEHIKVDATLAICAQRYGNLVDVFSNFRPNAAIFYSYNPVDCKEAERVKDLFTTIKVNYYHHTLISVFSIYSQDDIIKLANSLYEKAESGDDDLKYALPKSKEVMIKDLQNIKAPTLDVVFEYVFFYMNASENLKRQISFDNVFESIKFKEN